MLKPTIQVSKLSTFKLTLLPTDIVKMLNDTTSCNIPPSALMVVQIPVKDGGIPHYKAIFDFEPTSIEIIWTDNENSVELSE